MTITYDEISNPIFTLSKAETEELEQTGFCIAFDDEDGYDVCVTFTMVDGNKTYRVWSPMKQALDLGGLNLTY